MQIYLHTVGEDRSVGMTNVNLPWWLKSSGTDTTLCFVEFDLTFLTTKTGFDYSFTVFFFALLTCLNCPWCFFTHLCADELWSSEPSNPPPSVQITETD